MRHAMWGISYQNLMMLYREIPGEIDKESKKRIIRTKEEELETLSNFEDE